MLGVSIMMNSLESCSPLNYYESSIEQDKIIVPISKFIEGNNMVLIKNEKLEYDIALISYPNQQFKAFELKCTHQANSLVVTKTGFYCNLHGSSYNLNGKVINTPATTNLREYTLTTNSESITINL